MFWPFRRQTPRPTQRPPARLSLEDLEGRALPSVSVIPFTHPSSGADVLSNVSSAQPAVPLATHGSTNGAAGQIPAFFNGQPVTINVLELDTAEDRGLTNNPRVRIIYVSNDLDDPQDFSPVINAAPGQQFNALWQQVIYQFNPGSTPHQFTSEADILAAAKAGEITLLPTDEIYRDSVVGAGKNA
jgi:hypothetical protein